jgi:ubiquinone/menaquinone biosynthesis C-methylase UbiE
MDYKDIVKNGYNQIANDYLSARTSDSEDVRLLADFGELLSPDAKVQDAGCGAGVPITRLLAERFDVIGVDFSAAQIQLARQHVPKAKFLCADLTDLHFPQDFFDGICSYYAIIHIPREEHRALLEKFHFWLSTGGLALLCLGAKNLIDEIDEDFLGTRMYWSHFDSGTYRKMLKEIGLSIVWSRHVKDATCEGAGHLFVLAQKK